MDTALTKHAKTGLKEGKDREPFTELVLRPILKREEQGGETTEGMAVVPRILFIPKPSDR